MTTPPDRKAIISRQKLLGYIRKPNPPKPERPAAAYKPHEWHKVPEGELRERLREEYERALQPPDPWAA